MVLVIIICPQIAQAQSVPPNPCKYHGTVTVNGEKAPINTLISAEIDGMTRGGVNITESGQYNLYVFGTEGSTITFFVQTPTMSDKVQVAATSDYVNAGDIELNLALIQSITSTETHPVIKTPTITPTETHPVTKTPTITPTEYISATETVTSKEGEKTESSTSITTEAKNTTSENTTSDFEATTFIFVVVALMIILKLKT